MPARQHPNPAEGSSESGRVSGGFDGTPERLTTATLTVIAEAGFGAASARAIAAHAGVSPSAINYNFRSIEHLLQRALDHGVAETRAWQAARMGDVQALPASADGAALALLHIIQAWTGERRDLALAYQEAVLSAPGQGAATSWTASWRAFWSETAATFGLPEAAGALMHVFFEHEALHGLSTWSPALETAALIEMIDHFSAVWLGAPERAARGAVLLAEQRARIRPHGSIPVAALRIAQAAGEVVEDLGVAGLTHRAVASRAGVTTGSVTHHFRSIEDLLAGAIRGQVQALAEDADFQASLDIDGAPVSPSRWFETLRAHVAADAPPAAVLRRRRLFLAAVRRQDLAAASAVIRFSYGGTLRDSMSRVFATPDQMAPLRAGVLARLLSGLWLASAGEADAARARNALFDEIARAATARFARRTG